MPDDPNDAKVKDLLAGDAKLSDVVDAATRAELERWFGLPSFTELAEAKVEIPEDPQMVARREQRDKATSEVDPAMLERLHRRAEPNLLPVRVPPTIHADPSIARIDLASIEKLAAMIAEPRQVERPEDLEDDLKDVTPQALLRDLHRSEDMFQKYFEIVDMAAEQKFDVVAEVKKAIATSWKLPPLQIEPFRESYALVVEARRQRFEPVVWREGLLIPQRWVKNWS